MEFGIILAPVSMSTRVTVFRCSIKVMASEIPVLYRNKHEVPVVRKNMLSFEIYTFE